MKEFLKKYMREVYKYSGQFHYDEIMWNETEYTMFQEIENEILEEEKRLSNKIISETIHVPIHH